MCVCVCVCLCVHVLNAHHLDQVAAYDLDGSGEIRLDEFRKIHAVLEREVQGGLRSASNAVARRPSLGAPRLPFPPARATILV